MIRKPVKNKHFYPLYLTLGLCVFILSFTGHGVKPVKYVNVDTVAPKPVKKYSVTYSSEGWQERINWFSYIAQQLRRSDLPSKEVAFMTDSLITKFQIEIITQITPQIQKDTLTKK